MNSVILRCALLLIAITDWTELALARSYLNCPTKKVVIVDTPRGSASSNVEKHLGFWIDEAAKSRGGVDDVCGMGRTASRISTSCIHVPMTSKSFCMPSTCSN
jgi:hypothetical protein